MKVLVVGTGGAIVSGISTAADGLVRTLQQEGHVVERVVAGAAMRARPNALNAANVWAVVADAAGVARAVRRHRPTVVWLDVFGVPTLPALRALALALGARVAGAGVIVRFHAFGLEEAVAAGGRWLGWILRLLGRLSDTLVTVHEPAADALRQVVPQASVVSLPNWTDVPPEPVALPPAPPWVGVFVGGLVQRKGAPQVVEAARQLKRDDVVLRLVGGPGEDGEDALAALTASAADLQASGRVAFAGEVDGARVRAELDAAHFLVLPSAAEGMPMAMVEAMARGRPVLVSDAGNMGDVVREHRCGRLLTGRTPGEIASAIEALVDRPTEVGAAGARAHAVAKSSFSDEAAAERLRAILSSIAGR